MTRLTFFGSGSQYLHDTREHSHINSLRGGDSSTVLIRTSWTLGEGWESKDSDAENSKGQLHCCAHGLFILRISAGDLRDGFSVDWIEAYKWLVVTHMDGLMSQFQTLELIRTSP